MDDDLVTFIENTSTANLAYWSFWEKLFPVTLFSRILPVNFNHWRPVFHKCTILSWVFQMQTTEVDYHMDQNFPMNPYLSMVFRPSSIVTMLVYSLVLFCFFFSQILLACKSIYTCFVFLQYFVSSNFSLNSVFIIHESKWLKDIKN